MHDNATFQTVLALLRLHYSQRRIAQELHLYRSYIQRCQQQLRQKSGSKPKRFGPAPTLSGQAARRAVQLLAEDPHLDLKHTAQRLHAEGLTPRVMHRSTVARHAKQQAEADHNPIVHHRKQPGKKLTMDTISKRINFCQQHQLDDFADVLVTDRKRFMWTFPGTAVGPGYWAHKGEEVRAFKPNHPMCYNVYGGISSFGVAKLHKVIGTSGYHSCYRNKLSVVSKNITTAEYADVLLGILGEAGRVFSRQGITTFRLQQDNDPTHMGGSKQAVKSYNNGMHGGAVRIIEDWPPNSPDLSPIESAWGIVQQRVNARVCNTFQEFKDAVDEEWEGLEPAEIQHLMLSLPHRMQQCLKAHGAKLPY